MKWRAVSIVTAGSEGVLGDALYSIYKKTGNQFVLLIDEWDSIFRNYEEDTILQDKYIDLLRSWFKNTALDQIRERNYGDSLQEYNSSLSGYCGEVLLVGISYDAGRDSGTAVAGHAKDTVYKKHSCRIEVCKKL